MIGVTVRKGKEFRSLSEKAVSLFKKNTGIKNVVIIDIEEDSPYMAKLLLPSMLKQTFVFFDADLWFINEVDLFQFDNKQEFFAVKDIGRHRQEDFPRKDCYWNGIDAEDYVNTGFFIGNGRDQLTEKAFNYAIGLSNKVKVKDFGEQSYLNIGLQRLGVPIVHLPYDYNYPILCEEWEESHVAQTDHQFIAHPYAIHALGFLAPNKKDVLKHYKKLKHHEQLQLLQS